MEARYLYRHPTLTDAVGPLPAADLQQAIANGSLPADGMVCLASDAGEAVGAWQPIAEVLGTAAAMPEDPTLAALAEVRQKTAYHGTRVLITIAAVAVIVGAIVVGVTGLDMSLRLPPGEREDASFAAVVPMLLTIVIVLALRGLAVALLDLADCALQARSKR